MRIAICDDDMQEQKLLIDALHGWDPTRNAECFIDGESLLLAAKTQPPFTIVFLDIYMPGIDGMETAKRLTEISPQTGIVFVTTSTDHAIEAYSLKAVHYLVKPVTTAGVREAFSRIQHTLALRNVISVKVGRDVQMIYTDEIMTLQSANHQTDIILKSGRVISTYTQLGELKEKLDDSFLQIQRGLVVNMECIECMQSDSFMLRNGQKLLMSRKEKNSIRETFNDFVFRRLEQQRPKTDGGAE